MTEPYNLGIETDGNRQTGAIKLTMGGRSHGTFRDLEELLRYAARIKTGRIVLIPGTVQPPLALKIVSDNIKNQAANLKKMGFK